MDGIEAEQVTLEDTPDEAAAEAVVFGDCDERLARSPGNCNAVCGLIDDEALMPVVVCGEAPVAVSVEPSADEVGRVKGLEVTECVPVTV